MAPKKAAPAKGQQPKVVDTTFSGLIVEGCSLPLWDDAENDKESWGDLTVTGAVDPNTLFVDPDWTQPQVATLQSWVGDWKRPSAIFSPFKPVVYRPSLTANPYEWDPSKAEALVPPPPAVGGNAEEDDQPKLTSKTEVIAHYRSMKPVRLPASESESSDRDGSASPSPARRHVAKKAGGKLQAITPLFMRVLNSALMVLNQNQHLVPQGQYAWELIYPQQQATGFPQYNPHGKYAVKLFIGGAWRRVIIDDRLPTDINGHCMLSVTEQKEVWPALLAKAMMKALGPAHEFLLFKNPAWVVATLFGGWLPQTVSPVKEELLALKSIRQTMASRGVGGPVGDPILIATCGDSSQADVPIQDTEDSYVTNAGFHPNQGFHLLDMRPYGNTSLLRLAAPGAGWKGQYHYGSNSWNDVENFIGFTQADRNAADLNRKWNDFWLSWEQFARYFKSLVILRKVVDERRFANYRQIVYPPDVVVPETKAPAKGAAAAPAVPPPERGLPKNVTKWMHVNSDTPCMATFTLVGLAKPREKDGAVIPLPETTVTVHAFNSTASHPFNFISSMTVQPMTTQSMHVKVPTGPRAFRVTVENLPADTAVSIMSPCEITLGEEKDICKDLLDITSSSDAGLYGECKADVTTIWFKRHVAVKNPCTCNMFLSTLPKGSDVAQFRQLAVEAGAAGGAGAKGKAPAKPAKGGSKGDAAAMDISTDDIDDGSNHARPIMDYASLSIVDMDSNQVVFSDTIGKILQAKLVPNKAGYTIVATATPPEDYGKGLWRLSMTADRPFDAFEPRPFEEVVTRSGEYQHNDVSSLLRYNFTVSESATASVQLRVKETFGIPFKFQLFHNEKEIESREGTGSCFIHHLPLAPAPDKNTQSTYAVHCTLDKGYTQQWEDQRREHVVLQFGKDCSEQEAHLLQQQAQLREVLQTNPEATNSEEFNGERPGSVATQSTNIAYTLTIHSSTSKVDIKEDNSINEQLMAIKASWSKPKDAPEEGAGGKAKAPPKPAKGQPVVDEATIRLQKAKESRDKFLANRKGVFIPYAAPNGGKLILHPEDEPSCRMVPMKEAEELDASPRGHGGVGAEGGMLHGGLQGSPEKAAELVAAVAAAEPGTAAPATSTSSRPSAKDLLDEVQGQLNVQREARKKLHGEYQDAVSNFWGILKPDRAETADPDESIRGRKKSSAPGKK